MKEKFKTLCKIKINAKQTYYLEIIKHKEFYVIRVLDSTEEPKIVTKVETFKKLELRIIGYVATLMK